jgi:2'-5' RNA ligase
MKLKNLIPNVITENSTSTYSYGCVMLYFSFPEMEQIHAMIKPHHIYTETGDKTFGLEDEPHTTLLYGLHDEVSDEVVQKVLDKYTYHTCKVHNPSLFKSEKYDVLKFEVEGDNLHETNADLKQFPFTSSWPNYNPHLTIAYLQPGMGDLYVKLMNDLDLNEFSLAPQYAVYSHPDGSKTKMSINVD